MFSVHKLFSLVQFHLYISLLLLPMLLGSYLKKILAQIKHKENLLFSFSTFTYYLKFKALIHFAWLCIYCKIKSLLPGSFIEDAVLSPLCVVDTFVKHQLVVNA